MDLLAMMGNGKRVRVMSARPLPLINAAVILLLLSVLPVSQPYTYEQDVFAINGLYTALGSPALPNWSTNGGDPCNEGWQGVKCVFSNVTSIILSGANLGGQLGNTLVNFTSLITLDLSNNNIGGTIPDALPVTLQELFLSANQLSGNIPSALSTLTLLTSVSLNGNHLTGAIPDVFAGLTGVANLDFSNNSLTGPLPPSMGNLTKLTSLHIQNNQITGILNVLQDLPLQDLNIENNLFSGPVPVKLLNLPNFKKDGNPFNTTIAPSAQPPVASTPSPSPSAGHVPSKELPHSSNSPGGSNPASASGKNKVSTTKLVGYISIGVVAALIVGLIAMYCLSKYKDRKSRDDIYTKDQMGRVPQKLGGPKMKEMTEIKDPSIKLQNNVSKAPNFASNTNEEDKLNPPTTAASNLVSNTSKEKKMNLPTTASSNVVYDAKDRKGLDSSATAPPAQVTMKQKEHIIDVEKADNFVEGQHPSQPIAPRAEKATVDISVRTRRGRVPSFGKLELTTAAKSYSIASLQQYTNSFSKENFIRDSRFGKVYLAELPDGELLEVLKFDSFVSQIPEDAFLEMVATISELRHPNILCLVGYCAENEQRLLVYEHCGKMTLHDELHCLDDSNKPLSWNARLQVALGAAKALQHLHDGCRPPIVHQNFGSAAILLNSTLVVHVSECGLAALASKSVSQPSGRTLFHYEAPEVSASGSTSDRSDVYSFGVIMLELLTGRKPYDSSRPPAQQHLLRWTNLRLYDMHTISQIVDPSIKGQCSGKALSAIADIIRRCTQCEPEFRPPMSAVVQDLTRMVSNTRKASM